MAAQAGQHQPLPRAPLAGERERAGEPIEHPVAIEQLKEGANVPPAQGVATRHATSFRADAARADAARATAARRYGAGPVPTVPMGAGAQVEPVGATVTRRGVDRQAEVLR